MKRCLLLSLIAACGTPDKLPLNDNFSDIKSDMFSSKMKLNGALPAGKTRVAYQNPPRYQAFTVGSGAIDVWVRSTDGDAVAWLTDDKFKILAQNDDADGLDAHVTASAASYLIFRDYNLAAATFTLTLSATSPSVGRFAPPFDFAPEQIIEWSRTSAGPLRQTYRHNYQYDSRGRVSTRQDDTIIYSTGKWDTGQRFDYNYDGGGKLASYHVTEPGGTAAELWSYTYDSQGRATELTEQPLSNGAPQDVIARLSYDYNYPVGSLMTETERHKGYFHPDQWVLVYSTDYGLKNDVFSENKSSYSDLDQSDARFTSFDSQLDSDGNVQLQILRETEGGPPLGNLHYFYDSTGRIDRIDEYDGKDQNLTGQTRFSYTNGRLAHREVYSSQNGSLLLQSRRDITWSDQGTSTGFAATTVVPARQWALDYYGSGAYVSR